MIEVIIIIIIISIVVSIITEQLLIRRLKLEEGVTISKGKCILKQGYGKIEPITPTQPPPSLEARQNEVRQNEVRQNEQPELMNFYRPLK